MNSDQKWIVEAFLKSLIGIKLRGPEPGHKIDLRLQLAEMVLTELPGDDLEELANRAHAEALRDVYLTTDPQRHERYEQELRAYIKMLELQNTGNG
jgi:hypothetical protein